MRKLTKLACYRVTVGPLAGTVGRLASYSRRHNLCQLWLTRDRSCVVPLDAITERMTINTLADLYAYFGAQSFAGLNRRVYAITDCGASISIHGTLPWASAPKIARDAAVRAGYGTTTGVEYARVLPALEIAYAAADAEERARLERMDDDFRGGVPDALVTWARTVVPDAFPAAVLTPERVPVVFHDGWKEAIHDTFELTGFTIQSIVEGSDAEVASDVFRSGVDSADVVAWVENMEAETSRLWDAANGVGSETCPTCGEVNRAGSPCACGHRNADVILGNSGASTVTLGEPPQIGPAGERRSITIKALEGPVTLNGPLHSGVPRVLDRYASVQLVAVPGEEGEDGTWWQVDDWFATEKA